MTVVMKDLSEITDLVANGKLDEARKALSGFRDTDDESGELEHLQGYLKEQEFDFEEAIRLYEAALEKNPLHRSSLFRAALLNDRLGNDEDAIEYYEQCVRQDEAPVNALLNLAVLYEEDGLLDESAACVQSVLDRYPTHPRALLLEKSISSAYSMYYDERSQRDRDIRNAVLDTPVTEFELSVRSRNCLRQLNIRTLGDLLRITEPELMGYKNFGETSLREIKAMLASKGLRLGQSVLGAIQAEDAEAAAQAEAAAAEAPRPQPDANLDNRSVAELELSVRSRKCLQRLGVTTLGELLQKSETELMSIKNFGMTSLNEIKRELTARGLSLRA